MSQVTAHQLNLVATLLNTKDKNVVYSAVILSLVENGYSLEDAWNYVFGEGEYTKYANMLYDLLRNKA